MIPFYFLDARRSNGLFQTELEQDRELNHLTNTNRFLDIMLSFHTATGVRPGLDLELREWVSDPFCNLLGDLQGSHFSGLTKFPDFP